MVRAVWILFSLTILSGCKSGESSSEQTTSIDKDSVSESVSSKANVNVSPVINTYELVQLAERGVFNDLEVVELTTLDDPAYKSGPKTFVGYELGAVLSRLDGFYDYSPAEYSLRFVCKDGYRTTFSYDSLKGARGLLATGLKGNSNSWLPYLDGKTSRIPAPYYLVWADTPVSKDRPWPYQFTSIEVVSKAGLGDLLAPLESAFAEGRKAFESNCMACHSVNLVGGSMGPELNVPRNICEYRSTSFIQDFISSPQSYRAASPMPAMPFIKGKELKNLMGYLCHMAKRKVCATAEDCKQFGIKRR